MLTEKQHAWALKHKNDERIVSLFALRNNTDNIIVQCSADREIQKIFFKRLNTTDIEKALAYNNAVIHNPDWWYQVMRI